MECGLIEMTQPYSLCMWLLLIFMSMLVAAALCRLFPARREPLVGRHEEDLKPKSKTEILSIIERINRDEGSSFSEKSIDCCDKKCVSVHGPLNTTKKVRSKFIKSARKK